MLVYNVIEKAYKFRGMALMLSLVIIYIVYDAGDARGGGLRCC